MKKVIIGMVSFALVLTVACSGGAEKTTEVKQEKAKPANVAKPPAAPAKKEAPKPPAKPAEPAKQEGKQMPAKMENMPMHKGGMKQAPGQPQKMMQGNQMKPAGGPQKMAPNVNKGVPAKGLKKQGGPQKIMMPKGKQQKK